MLCWLTGENLKAEEKKHFINIHCYFNNNKKKKVKHCCQELTVYLLHILFVLAGTNGAIISCQPLNFVPCFIHRQTLTL